MPVYASNSRMVIDGEAEDGLYESKPSTDAPFHQEMGEEAKQVEEKVWLAVTDKEGDFHVSNLLAFFLLVGSTHHPGDFLRSCPYRSARWFIRPNGLMIFLKV